MNPTLRRTAARLASRFGFRGRPPTPSRERGRLAFVGPMPPAPTGVATYDRAVLEGLERTGFLERRPVDVLWPIHRRARRSISGYDLGIFQMGNNIEHHREVYRLAAEAPGLVVLHDIAIDGFVRELDVSGDELGRRALREAAAQPFYPEDADVAIHEPLRVVWCAAILRMARGVIVHSEFCRRYLRSTGSRTPIFTVPHPAVESPAAIGAAEVGGRELRAKLEARGVRRLLVAPGDVNETKQHGAILAALAGLPPDVHLAIVGRPSGTYRIERLVDRFGVGGRVTLRLGVADDEFLAWLAAADVVIDLRHPHRGEVSGSLARSMQLGRPTIVSATGTYLDAPPGSTFGVAPGPTDGQELREAISSLLQDDAGRARMGEVAAAHIRRLTETEATARGYEEAIGRTLELLHDPEHLVLERWSRSLVELGVDEAMAADGFGLSYARGIRELRE
jgi:glycosyltransferase involved in cell wall biosynthesis